MVQIFKSWDNRWIHRSPLMHGVLLHLKRNPAAGQNKTVLLRKQDAVLFICLLGYERADGISHVTERWWSVWRTRTELIWQHIWVNKVYRWRCYLFLWSCPCCLHAVHPGGAKKCSPGDSTPQRSNCGRLHHRHWRGLQTGISEEPSTHLQYVSEKDF